MTSEQKRSGGRLLLGYLKSCGKPLWIFATTIGFPTCQRLSGFSSNEVSNAVMAITAREIAEGHYAVQAQTSHRLQPVAFIYLKERKCQRKKLLV